MISSLHHFGGVHHEARSSQKTLQSVDQELVSVDSELNSANQKLRALQEELVAFESTSKRLRDEAEKAALIAQQKR